MSLQNRKIKLPGQNGKTIFQGIFAFTTTGLTKSVSVPMRRIESVFVKPIGAAAVTYRTIGRRVGAVTATASIPIITPPYAGTLIAAKITVDTTHATHEDNHWTFTLVNKGQAAAGTTDMILATAANSTDATAGAAITAFIARSLTLHGTAANLVTAASDVLALVCTKAATATSLAGLEVELTFDFGDSAEALSANATVSGTAGTGDAAMFGSNGATAVVVTRNGVNPTSARKFSLLAIGY